MVPPWMAAPRDPGIVVTCEETFGQLMRPLSEKPAGCMCSKNSSLIEEE